MSSKGLGDTVAKITKAIGIEPCPGCKKRQEKLNKIFPYQKGTMTDEQREAYIKVKDKTTLQNEDLNVIQNTYNAVFQTNVKPCRSCSYQTWKVLIDRLNEIL